MKKLLLSLIFLMDLCVLAASAQSLEQRFNHYSDQAKPRTWWHWMNGAISKEGITHDLEQMAKAGFGGCYIFNVSDNMPAGPVKMLSKQWYDLTLFSIREADRLGLEWGMHNCPGWSSSGGPWNDPEHAMQKLVFSETTVKGGRKTDVIIPCPTSQEYYRDVVVLAFPMLVGDEKGKGYRFHNWEKKSGVVQKVTGADFTPAQKTVPENIVDPAEIVDVSAFMDKDGRLRWSAPEGMWTVIRFGHTYIEKHNHPAPKEGTGLEVDKFSRKAVKRHFDAYCGKIIEMAKPYVGKTFTTITIDSYEMGIQNWTALFPEEFAERRGYDIVPFLPAMTGRVVASPEQTERFLWDMRKTINDLFVDNYYGYMHELVSDAGLLLSTEPYGNINVNQLEIGQVPDIPMSEFWAAREPGAGVHMVSSVGRIYGKNIIESESFTAQPYEGVWYHHPYTLKRVGDIAYAQGVSRYVFHSFPHQPRPDIFPGVTMGPHGTFFASSNTWFGPGKAWFEYHSRCQELLQAGLHAGDVLYYVGEDAPLNTSTLQKKILETLGKGYPFDYCNRDVILNRLCVKDGALVFPDGLSYRLLVLPDDVSMTPELAVKLKELIAAGACVLGPRPVISKGLSGYPKSDQVVRAIGREVWGTDTSASGEKTYGKGHIWWGVPVRDVLEKMNLKEDFSYKAVCGKPDLNYIHRRIDGAEVYFVANRASEDAKAVCTFRVDGKSPEFWNPVNGEILRPAVYCGKNGNVSILLEFAAHESVFVVFRSADKADPIREVICEGEPCIEKIRFTGLNFDARGNLRSDIAREGRYEIVRESGKTETVKVAGVKTADLSQGWSVWFDPKMGGHGETSFARLNCWTENPDQEIKYYSGTARYTKEVNLPGSMTKKGRRIYLEFEKIADIGKISINGQSCGTLWTPPYRMDVTRYVKPGKNVIQVEVTNTWNNRLIGDERYPTDVPFVEPQEKFKGSFGIKEWPEWLLSGNPRPQSRRVAFATWRVYTIDSPLLPSGIIGSVKIVSYPQKEL